MSNTTDTTPTEALQAPHPATEPDNSMAEIPDTTEAPSAIDYTAEQLKTAIFGEKEFSTTPNLTTHIHLHHPDGKKSPENDQKPPPERVLLAFTGIESLRPDRLTKIIGVDESGKMTKQAAANMTRGKATTVQVTGLNELLETLDGLTSAQAVAWGITKSPDTINLCTEGDHEAQAHGAIPRTRKHFRFASGMPGVMMLDHDGVADGMANLSPDQFRQRLIDAVPVLADAPMLYRPSASAGCVRADGVVLSGLTRHRLYIPVTDASKIPEAGKVLEQALWASGNGWCIVGAAGQKLKRTLIDGSVWQPERLDFAGPPVLTHGVTRPNCQGRIYGDEAGQFDLERILALTNATLEKKAKAAITAAEKAVQPDCDTARKKWVQEHAPALAQRRGIALRSATNTLDRAAAFQVLTGDFELTVQDGSTVTVGQILDDPNRWHDQRFADPLDPGTDRRVAVARLLNGGRPDIFSHRHGGMRYELRRQSARVQIGKGMRIESTDAVLRVLRDRNELFDFGPNAVAYVTEGRAVPVTRDWLVDHCGRCVEFYSIKKTEDEVKEIAEDAPTGIAMAILAKHGQRGFRKLTAVITAPTLRLDGSVIDEPGHDAATGLMYTLTDVLPPAVPLHPTPQQALDALARIWAPFHKFPFVDDVGRGVTIAAILSACVRAVLPTCPAFGFDAPAAGTGKTLLARCIATLATGTEPSVLPPATEEDECRKRLFAELRRGSRAILWDNVRDPLGNAAIDSFLTASLFADRVLGVSETVELPNRALFLLTGNNLVLTGDTFRRVLAARLDADTETPFKREFSFDALEMVQSNRLALVVDVLTIIRAYITAGRQKAAPGRIASFEQWDDLVRQPVCWLAGIVKESGRDLIDMPSFADPSLAIDSAESVNPETAKLTALLNVLSKTFGTHQQTPKQMIHAATDGKDVLNENLFDALDEVAGQNGKLNVRILGRWLERNKDCLTDGLRLKLTSQAHGFKHWTVIKSKERTERDANPEEVVKVNMGGEIRGAKTSVKPDTEVF